ncbi:TetR/AcrR family transcriptional regulator [Vogesella sp. GCM10023246]|uniref:Helix-turn-helix domain-containing protein n=1 Tax=Vogesella oryzagri TaxID=3160864 RepID=A0ABV1M3Q1_9NEIS
MNDVHIFGAAMENLSRRERKQRESADLIADAAYALFEQRGYDQVSMEDIARAADVAKGTLYSRFPAKEAILVHCFHRALAADAPQLLHDLQQLADCRSRLRHFFHASAAWSRQQRGYLRPYLRYRFATAFDAQRERSQLGMLLSSLLAAGVAAGEVRADLPLPQLVLALEMLYSGVLMTWLEQDDDLTQRMDDMLALFFAGAEVRHA